MTTNMRTRSVTVKMTPRQAIDAEQALVRQAVVTENGRLYSAAGQVRSGLYDAGWNIHNHGTDDRPIWAWERSA